MNHFPQNLSILRRRAGYTQESLAEVLGVSRQAVSKWEGGQGLPEAATLLTLADLLGCSLDTLMREELTEDAPTPEQGQTPAEDPYYLWEIFSQHMVRFGFTMAAGVALILGGVSTTVALAGFFGDDTGLIAVPLLLCVAVAVFLFIFGGLDHDNFMKAYSQPPFCPDPEEEARFRQVFRFGVAGAVAGILVGVTLLVVAGSLLGEEGPFMYFAASAFLALLAVCVFVLVYLGIQNDKYDEDADFRVEAREREAHGNGPDVEGVIMLIATGIFLWIGFVHNAWHPGWVVFPIGGICCTIVSELRKGGKGGC